MKTKVSLSTVATMLLTSQVVNAQPVTNVTQPIQDNNQNQEQSQKVINNVKSALTVAFQQTSQDKALSAIQVKASLLAQNDALGNSAN